MADEPQPLGVFERPGTSIRRLAQILLDLHRCRHGRLPGDPCGDCNGTSVGNALLPPGTVIGHTRHGDAIVVPSWGSHNDPQAWIQRP